MNLPVRPWHIAHPVRVRLENDAALCLDSCGSTGIGEERVGKGIRVRRQLAELRCKRWRLAAAVAPVAVADSFETQLQHHEAQNASDDCPKQVLMVVAVMTVMV